MNDRGLISPHGFNDKSDVDGDNDGNDSEEGSLINIQPSKKVSKGSDHRTPMAGVGPIQRDVGEETSVRPRT